MEPEIVTTSNSDSGGVDDENSNAQDNEPQLMESSTPMMDESQSQKEEETSSPLCSQKDNLEDKPYDLESPTNDEKKEDLLAMTTTTTTEDAANSPPPLDENDPEDILSASASASPPPTLSCSPSISLDDEYDDANDDYAKRKQELDKELEEEQQMVNLQRLRLKEELTADSVLDSSSPPDNDKATTEIATNEPSDNIMNNQGDDVDNDPTDDYDNTPSNLEREEGQKENESSPLSSQPNGTQASLLSFDDDDDDGISNLPTQDNCISYDNDDGESETNVDPKPISLDDGNDHNTNQPTDADVKTNGAVEEDDDFGDFEEGVTADTSNYNDQNQNVNDESCLQTSDPVDNAHQTTITQEGNDDDLGDFTQGPIEHDTSEKENGNDEDNMNSVQSGHGTDDKVIPPNEEDFENTTTASATATIVSTTEATDNNSENHLIDNERQEEKDNADEFGEFADSRTGNDDNCKTSTAEETIDIDDGFGNFEQPKGDNNVVENDTHPSLVVDSNDESEAELDEEENFGDFAHSTPTPNDAHSTAVVESDTVPEPESASSDTKEQNEEFGDFESDQIEQIHDNNNNDDEHITDQTSSVTEIPDTQPKSESVPTSPSPPLSKESEIDDFGEFNDVDAPANKTSIKVDSNENVQDSNNTQQVVTDIDGIEDNNEVTNKNFVSNEEEENFGDFAQNDKPQVDGDSNLDPENTAIPDSDAAIQNTVEEEDEEFGDFGDFEQNDEPQVDGDSNLDPENNTVKQNVVDQEFEDFRDSNENEDNAADDGGTSPENIAEDDEEFGDFGDFNQNNENQENNVSEPGPDVTDINQIAPEEDDEFGDFGEFEQSSDFQTEGDPNINPDSNNAKQDVVEEDDEFGDFGDFEAHDKGNELKEDGEKANKDEIKTENPHPTDTIEKKVEDGGINEDDFGDFNDVEVTPPGLAQENDFGDFEDSSVSTARQSNENNKNKLFLERTSTMFRDIFGRFASEMDEDKTDDQECDTKDRIKDLALASVLTSYPGKVGFTTNISESRHKLTNELFDNTTTHVIPSNVIIGNAIQHPHSLYLHAAGTSDKIERALNVDTSHDKGSFEVKPALASIGTGETDNKVSVTQTDALKQDGDGEDFSDEDFGDFHAPTEDESQSGNVNGSQTTANIEDDVTKTESQTVDEQNGTDEEFGEFGDFNDTNTTSSSLPVQNGFDEFSTQPISSTNTMHLHQNPDQGLDSPNFSKQSGEKENINAINNISEDVDDFGGFHAPEATCDVVNELPAVEPKIEENQDEFGGFGDFHESEAVDDTSNQPPFEEQKIEENDEDFGGFGDFHESEAVGNTSKQLPVEEPTIKEHGVMNNNGSDFHGSEAANDSVKAEGNGEVDYDGADFSAFHESEVLNSTTNQRERHSETDDNNSSTDFGDFGDFHESEPVDDPSNQLKVDEQEIEEHDKIEIDNVDDDVEDFGDFNKSEAIPIEEPKVEDNDKTDGDFDDFGDFHDSEVKNEIITTEPKLFGDEFVSSSLVMPPKEYPSTMPPPPPEPISSEPQLASYNDNFPPATSEMSNSGMSINMNIASTGFLPTLETPHMSADPQPQADSEFNDDDFGDFHDLTNALPTVEPSNETINDFVCVNGADVVDPSGRDNVEGVTSLPEIESSNPTCPPTAVGNFHDDTVDETISNTTSFGNLTVQDTVAGNGLIPSPSLASAPEAESKSVPVLTLDDTYKEKDDSSILPEMKKASLDNLNELYPAAEHHIGGNDGLIPSPSSKTFEVNGVDVSSQYLGSDEKMSIPTLSGRDHGATEFNNQNETNLLTLDQHPIGPEDIPSMMPPPPEPPASKPQFTSAITENSMNLPSASFLPNLETPHISTDLEPQAESVFSDDGFGDFHDSTNTLPTAEPINDFVCVDVADWNGNGEGEGEGEGVTSLPENQSSNQMDPPMAVDEDDFGDFHDAEVSNSDLVPQNTTVDGLISKETPTFPTTPLGNRTVQDTTADNNGLIPSPEAKEVQSSLCFDENSKQPKTYSEEKMDEPPAKSSDSGSMNGIQANVNTFITQSAHLPTVDSFGDSGIAPSSMTNPMNTLSMPNLMEATASSDVFIPSPNAQRTKSEGDFNISVDIAPCPLTVDEDSSNNVPGFESKAITSFVNEPQPAPLTNVQGMNDMSNPTTSQNSQMTYPTQTGAPLMTMNMSPSYPNGPSSSMPMATSYQTTQQQAYNMPNNNMSSLMNPMMGENNTNTFSIPSPVHSQPQYEWSSTQQQQPMETVPSLMPNQADTMTSTIDAQTLNPQQSYAMNGISHDPNVSTGNNMMSFHSPQHNCNDLDIFQAETDDDGFGEFQS